MEDMKEENERYYLGIPMNDMYPKTTPKLFRLCYGMNTLNRNKEKKAIQPKKSLCFERPKTSAISAGLKSKYDR